LGIAIVGQTGAFVRDSAPVMRTASAMAIGVITIILAIVILLLIIVIVLPVPTAHGNTNGHMLRILKSLATKAGLNGEFKLHKFRKTYATLQHRDGVRREDYTEEVGAFRSVYNARIPGRRGAAVGSQPQTGERNIWCVCVMLVS
jgi:hypothetical protein